MTLDALANFLAPIGFLVIMVGFLRGAMDLSRGYPGGLGRILGGFVLGGTLLAAPSLLPALTSSVNPDNDGSVFAGLFDSETKDTGKDTGENKPATDTNTADANTDGSGTDGGEENPFADIPAETIFWVLGSIAALALTLGLIAAIYFAVRHQRRKHATVLAAAEQARIEEEARLDRVWAEAVARHDHLREEMMRHQSDIDLVLSMPLINDQNDPKTAAFTEALARAADLAHDTRPASATAVDAYATATRAADRAWGAAWRNADRIRLAQFGPDERATIKQVAKLMHRAENETSAEARNTYYRKAMSMLGDLIEIPRPAAEAIEQRIAGVLANPHATSTSADASGDAARTGTGPILTGLLRKARPKVTATP